MQLPATRPSSRIRRSAAICMFRLVSSTAVARHTAAVNSSLDTSSSARSTSTSRTSRAREPSAIGTKAPAPSRRNNVRTCRSQRKRSNRKTPVLAGASVSSTRSPRFCNFSGNLRLFIRGS